MPTTPIDPHNGWAVTPLGRIAAPLREQVTAELRRAILELELKPGQRLIERELIEKLGVSRATVREALRELGSEGLVIVEPQRGAFVAAPTPDEALEMYEIRAVLESLLLRKFIEHADDAQVGRLAESVQEYERVATAEAEVKDALSAKDGFYDVLHEGAQSPTLTQLLGGLNARVRVLRATSLSRPGRSEQVVAELQGIVDAVIARDADLAAQRCAEHIRTASRTAMAGLRDQQGHSEAHATRA
ncbi:MAG: GntR family transcriptional regulator [Microbacterium sp.]